MRKPNIPFNGHDLCLNSYIYVFFTLDLNNNTKMTYSTAKPDDNSISVFNKGNEVGLTR